MRPDLLGAVTTDPPLLLTEEGSDEGGRLPRGTSMRLSWGGIGLRVRSIRAQCGVFGWGPLRLTSAESSASGGKARDS